MIVSSYYDGGQRFLVRSQIIIDYMEMINWIMCTFLYVKLQMMLAFKGQSEKFLGITNKGKVVYIWPPKPCLGGIHSMA